MGVDSMTYRMIFDSLQKMNGIIACGILDEVGKILECKVPDSFPKEELSQLYAIEAGMLRNHEKHFGEFSYRLSQFGNAAQIIYRYKGIYIVASSTNSAEALLDQVRKATR
jgi:hypothetical protein